MCGRYTQAGIDAGALAARFGVGATTVPPETLGRFNMCPTETLLAITSGPAARGLRWGLKPAWGKGPEPINARADTVTVKPMFARLVERAERRCLVVADGWYEWLRPEDRKGPRIPFHYRVDGGEPFAFAGLWDGRESACILTTDANGVCRPVHDRMPCVLAGPDEEAAWLSGDVDAAGAVELLGPLPDERVTAVPANPAVNKAGVEGAELLVAP